MKRILNLCLAIAFFTACSSDKLDRGKALKLIQDKKLYPKVIDYEIYTADPVEAKKMLDAGIEKEGIVTVQRTQGLMDIGEPIILFTNKAKPYLLPISSEDRKSKVQRVKIADEDLEGITGVQLLESEKKAVVEYRTSYKNITPFSLLISLKSGQTNTHKAYFSLYDDGWRLVTK